MRSFLVIGLVLAVATPPAALSQTICLPADAQTATLKLDISRYSSATAGDEKIVRDSLRLPYVPENQVTVVSQEATCRKANAALQSLFANTGNNTSRVVCMSSRLGRLMPSWIPPTGMTLASRAGQSSFSIHVSTRSAQRSKRLSKHMQSQPAHAVVLAGSL
jgi:hypothetical protein